VHLLVLDSLFDSLEVERAEAVGRGWTLERWTGAHEELLNADVVAHVRTRVGAELIERLPRCRVIARFGTGLDTVDLGAAQAAGMAVIGVRDYCIPELSSHTLGLVFALRRRLGAVWSGEARELPWQDFADRFPIDGGTNATVVGFGSIGRAVAVALAAIGFKTTVVTRHGDAAARSAGFDVLPLDEGLGRADVVLLHSSLEPRSERMMDAGRLERMRTGAVLVNTARLGLLDEAAVADAVDAGQLGGLGLDAQLPATSPLRALMAHPNVLLTPHVGWYSARSARELRVTTVRRGIEAHSASVVEAKT
jgi:phosphoglycerate dehydrogenase-like enzyme